MMLKGVGELRIILTLDLEIQSLEFVQLSFSLGLVQDFITVFPPPFWDCHVYSVPLCVLEVHDLLFDSDFTVKRLHESQKRLWTFKEHQDCYRLWKFLKFE